MVDYRDPDLSGRLRALAPDGVDLYVDTSGHLDLPAAVDLLATRGRLVLLAGGGQRLTLPVGPLYTHDRRILGFVISLAGAAELAEAAAVSTAGSPLGSCRCGSTTSGRWSVPPRPTRPSSTACAAGSCCGSLRPSPLDGITLAI